MFAILRRLCVCLRRLCTCADSKTSAATPWCISPRHRSRLAQPSLHALSARRRWRCIIAAAARRTLRIPSAVSHSVLNARPSSKRVGSKTRSSLASARCVASACCPHAKKARRGAMSTSAAITTAQHPHICSARSSTKQCHDDIARKWTFFRLAETADA